MVGREYLLVAVLEKNIYWLPGAGFLSYSFLSYNTTRLLPGTFKFGHSTLDIKRKKRPTPNDQLPMTKEKRWTLDINFFL